MNSRTPQRRLHQDPSVPTSAGGVSFQGVKEREASAYNFLAVQLLSIFFKQSRLRKKHIFHVAQADLKFLLYLRMTLPF